LVDFWNCTVPAMAGAIVALRSTVSLYCRVVGVTVSVTAGFAFSITIVLVSDAEL